MVLASSLASASDREEDPSHTCSAEDGTITVWDIGCIDYSAICCRSPLLKGRRHLDLFDTMAAAYYFDI